MDRAQGLWSKGNGFESSCSPTWSVLWQGTLSQLPCSTQGSCKVNVYRSVDRIVAPEMAACVFKRDATWFWWFIRSTKFRSLGIKLQGFSCVSLLNLICLRDTFVYLSLFDEITRNIDQSLFSPPVLPVCNLINSLSLRNLTQHAMAEDLSATSGLLLGSRGSEVTEVILAAKSVPAAYLSTSSGVLATPLAMTYNK